MVLLTGGLGYIGSHTAAEFIHAGYDVVIVDNLSNSDIGVLDNIEKAVKEKAKSKLNMGALDNINRVARAKPKFYQGDVRDKALLERIFSENKIDTVIHFAGLKAVGESVQKPIEYYNNNLISTLSLVETMRKAEVFNLVFSSSATVYGRAEKMPITEDMALSATNPYGRTKLFIEDILRDCSVSDKRWNIALLRYFNPVGADESGLLGEDPSGIPNNLMPYITRVATGKLQKLSIFGNDYPTPDGTGVRDYLHVTDLAVGHVKAMQYLEKEKVGCLAINLGTGKGYSVLEMVNAFNKVNGNLVKYEFGPRRAGDVDVCYADSSLAKKLLGWEARKSLEDMCRSAYAFERKKNSNG